MKNQNSNEKKSSKKKSSEVVMIVLFLIFLMFLSEHPINTAILFGSAYLLRWQAGGITLHGFCKNLTALILFWIVGVLSCPFVCPTWVLYPFLFLLNTIIYLFAPATNQVQMMEQAANAEEQVKQKEFDCSRQQKKNRALFITGTLSIAIILTHGTPISSLLLVTLLAQMISILSVIWQTLQTEPWKL